MHVHLRKRYRNAAFVEDFLRGLEHVEIDSPIIRSLDPYAQIKDERVASLLAETNKGGGIAQDKLMRAGKLSERILDEIDVGIVGDAEFEIETADFLCAVIGDGLMGS